MGSWGSQEKRSAILDFLTAVFTGAQELKKEVQLGVDKVNAWELPKIPGLVGTRF